MIGRALQLTNTIFLWLKDRSLKEILLLVCFLALLFTAWTANSYQNKYLETNTKLTRITAELRIEKENSKIEENEAENVELKKEINRANKELVVLYRDLKKLKDMKTTRTEIMEGINYVEDTETACLALADMGHPICDP